MSQVSQEAVLAALRKVEDPDLKQDLVSLGMIRDLEIEGGKVRFTIVLTTPACPLKSKMEADARDAVAALPGVESVEVKMDAEVPNDGRTRGLLKVPVRNAIAVGSGKGGVGKSTVAVNVAVALAQAGARVGLLDADIYGPSQPRMLGVSGSKPESKDGRSLEPINSYHLQIMSIGFLVDEDTPMIWRGPMVTQALEQLLKDTQWKDLDYLIIDLPPGTGDTQLTLAQKVPVSGAVIVTTPQDIALLDALKGLKMFDKVEVPVLGIVENMSIHICSNCGHEEHIFGEGGGQRMAEEEEVDYLGGIPLDKSIREMADNGKPTVVGDPDSRTAEIYREIARRAAGRLAMQGKDYSAAFPNIVIQNT